MLPDSIPFTLLREHAFNAFVQPSRQCLISDSRLRGADREQSRHLATGLSQRDRLWATSHFEGRAPRLYLVNQVAQLLGTSFLASARRLCPNWNGRRVKTRVIALGLAPDESFDLVCSGHSGGGTGPSGA